MRPIAVIGMSGRFPMSRDVDEYWQNLCSGSECIRFFENDEGLAGLATSDEEHFVPAGGFVDGIDEFDARFFGFSARDAEGMDPQHRIFLECAWHGLERAGYNPEAYPGSIGVYAGAAMSSYLTDFYASDVDLAAVDHYGLAIGNDKDHVTTQVSYKLNLRGPSVTVQTACSTSLVAVCMACQALQDGHCDIALAGGVAADMGTGRGYFYQPGSIFSPDGHCRPFDESAAGTVTGNGVGVVVLKRLSDALSDGDHVHAVIKGYGVNNDGSRKVGYTAPSIDGQAEVIAMAQEMAGCDPSTIGYVEAHGTGTPLGDPIEMAALDKVFRSATSRRQFCAVGSVKSNIGHLDTAAGVASLIKTVLVLERGLIPPSLHCPHPNPRIDFANTAFYVNTTLAVWEPDDGPRRAGVSSFGIGGTNAHVVLEEPPPALPSKPGRPFSLVTLSARTPEALERATDDLASHLQQRPEDDLADITYSLMIGRKAFEHRRAAIVDGRDNTAAGETLRQRTPSTVVTGSTKAQSPTPVVFMFPGQGTQALDMGLGLYQCEARFRAQVDQSCEILLPTLGIDLRELLYPTSDQRDGAERDLQQTALTQPALFVVEHALAQLWSEWGIVPDAMIGHSVGEYVAACLAEVLSLEDALSVVAERGRLMQRADPGAMLAVPLPEAALTAYLGGDLSLAAVNGPAACVASGTSAAVHDLEARLASRGIGSKRLRTSHGYHSKQMDSAVRPLIEKLSTLPLRRPRVPYLSNVTGDWITPDQAMNPHYWGLQLRQTVRFADQLEELLTSTPAAVLLEVGPGRTLGDLARSHPDRRSTHVIATSLAKRSPDHDVPGMLHSLGTMWVHGVQPSIEGFFSHERRRRLPLPTYPFEHERYWLDGAPEGDGDLADFAGPPTTGTGSSLYRLGWVPSAPVVERTGQADHPSRCLVFHDGTATSARVVQALKRTRHEVVQVLPGDDFEEKSADTVVIRPGNEADYAALLSRLAQHGGLPDSVAHLWGLAPDSGATAISATGFLSLVYLTKTLEHLAAGPTRIDVVADGLHQVVGDEMLVPEKACLLGACRVIPQEHPQISCRLIDVESRALDDEGAYAAAEAMVAELSAATVEPVVAYRRGRRWLQTVERFDLDPFSSQRRTRPHGVYLITGGLGRVGMVHAEHLARSGAGSLVLTGRTSLPDGSDGRAPVDAEDPSGDRVRAIGRLRDMDVAVSYACVDASDRDGMASLVRTVRETLGPINGVIHAAGDPQGYASVMETSAPSTGDQLRGKAMGAKVLADLIHDGTIDSRQLDFCMLVSSLSAILGGAGLAAYAAANCYLDALAAEENRRGGVPWISVNWDAWHFGEQENRTASGREHAGTLLPARCEQLLARILARAPGQVAVSGDDLSERYDLWVRRAGAPRPEERGPEESIAIEAAAPVSPSTPHRPPALDNAYVAARTPHEQALVDIWESLLGVAPIGVLDDFFELGGHSLLAIQLVSRLRLELGRECRVQQVFDAPTIAGLADRLAAGTGGPAEDAQRLLAAVESLSEDDALALLSSQTPDSDASGGGADA